MEAFHHRINTHLESWLGPRGESISTSSIAELLLRFVRPRSPFVSRSAGARLVAAGPLSAHLRADRRLSPDRVAGAQVHEAQAAVLLPRCHDDLQPGPHTAVLLHVLRGERSQPLVS